MGNPSSVSEATPIKEKVLLEAFRLMCTARSLSDIYEQEKAVCSKYVHSTSRGHEAIQLAAALQLKAQDYAALYYRDDSMLLGMGISPYELMLQLMAKADDPFSAGRSYYCHPSLKREGFPTIPHQSSATGMQAIPATGMAHGLKYLEEQGILKGRNKPVVLCSLGDGSVTEGEVSEAFQMAALKQLPIIFLIQDNEWGISATGAEMRTMDAYEFAQGFKGMEAVRVHGWDFMEAYKGMAEAVDTVRKQRRPLLVHAPCPLLGHHTSGVRKEWYRSEQDLEKHQEMDPLPQLQSSMQILGIAEAKLEQIKQKAADEVKAAYKQAIAAADPPVGDLMDYEFAPTPIVEELGVRTPAGGEKVVMVDAALHAVDDILKSEPRALFYGQDVGGALGGVFREAANLTKKYGESRVFNTPIQEAYIIGSTAGMSAVDCKPIVEVQFADYIWPGINQLVEELSKSCYLSRGQFPIQSLIRVPIGAYGGGGPYHSGSVESTLLNIRGVKVVYPSNAADMKGLFKAAFYDPNPVLMLEHKGLYWSKVPGTDAAKTVEPDEDYIIPLGKGLKVQSADAQLVEQGSAMVIITYGMGVHWSLHASKELKERVSIVDLRSLNPIDWELIQQEVQAHSRCLVLTEEPVLNSFAESLAGRISKACWHHLDAPVSICGAANLPAVPLNVELEAAMLPNTEKVRAEIDGLLAY